MFSVGNIDDENDKIDKSFNPEILHPEVHFHPTHLHNGHLDNVQVEEEESNSINGKKHLSKCIVSAVCISLTKIYG